MQMSETTVMLTDVGRMEPFKDNVLNSKTLVGWVWCRGVQLKAHNSVLILDPPRLLVCSGSLDI